MYFFFSSRRRHTRCLSDWSSDVCSSDLAVSAGFYARTVDFDAEASTDIRTANGSSDVFVRSVGLSASTLDALIRSEERRVGKVGRAWRPSYQKTENGMVTIP